MESFERPEVTSCHLIDDRRLELVWSCHVRNAGDERNFHVTLDGRELPLYRWHLADEWSYGCLYEKELMRTTLALVDPVDPERDELVVRVSPEVMSYDDVAANPNVSYKAVYKPHYEQFYTSATGVVVKAAADVDPASLKLCADTADVMLGKHPEIGETLAKNGADIALYSKKVKIWDVPEHRCGYITADRTPDGLSGVPGNPTSSLSESNILRLLTGRYKTGFKNESVMAHEFGHAVHLVGIDLLEDKTLSKRVVADYEAARDAGLWPNTYAISNAMEYFATMTSIWFDAMSEGSEGTWDGVRGPVNTREELKRYDPRTYDLMAEVYPDCHLPAPWDGGTENLYDIDGTPYEK